MVFQTYGLRNRFSSRAMNIWLSPGTSERLLSDPQRLEVEIDVSNRPKALDSSGGASIHNGESDFGFIHGSRNQHSMDAFLHKQLVSINCCVDRRPLQDVQRS